jgi:hypothetical protein
LKAIRCRQLDILPHRVIHFGWRNGTRYSN